MKLHLLADDKNFYNKYSLVYIITLVNWVKLDPRKQQKEVIMKKDLVSVEFICIVSLVVKKQI